FVRGDVGQPPIRTASADVVLARYVLWLLSDPAGVLRRWARLLRPAGKLVLVEDRWWLAPRGIRRDLLDVVGCALPGAAVARLDDEDLWGGPIGDERIVVMAGPAPTHRAGGRRRDPDTT